MKVSTGRCTDRQTPGFLKTFCDLHYGLGIYWSFLIIIAESVSSDLIWWSLDNLTANSEGLFNIGETCMVLQANFVKPETYKTENILLDFFAVGEDRLSHSISNNENPRVSNLLRVNGGKNCLTTLTFIILTSDLLVMTFTLVTVTFDLDIFRLLSNF